MGVLDFFVENAKVNFRDDQQSNIKRHIVKLSDQQRKRIFLCKGYLPPEGLRECAKCGHPSVDMPDTNKGVAIRNLERQRAYDQAKKEFEEQKNKKPAAGDKDGQGKKKRAPRKPTLEDTYMHCHCYQFQCYGKPSLATNTCPIMCIDPTTNDYYPISQDVGCTCPLCACNCCFAVKEGHNADVARAARLVQRKSNEAATEPYSNALSIEESSRVLVDSFEGALRDVAMETFRNSAITIPLLLGNNQEGKAGGAPKPPSLNMGMLSEEAKDRAAHEITKVFSDDRHKNFVHNLRQGYGKPQTKIKMPDGSWADTRQIQLDKSRERNNRLKKMAPQVTPASVPSSSGQRRTTPSQNVLFTRNDRLKK